MKVLIFSTRPLTGRFVTSLVQQFKVVETVSSDIDLLSMTKTDSSANYVEKMTGLTVNPVFYFSDFYFNVARNLENWEAIYEALDVSELRKYDHIFIFGGLLSDGSNLKRGQKRDGVFPVGNDRGQIKFNSVGLPITCILAILKACREHGVNVHEVAYDQQEVSLSMLHPTYRPTSNYTLYHGYDHPEYGYRRLDSLQYYNKNKMEFESEVEKSIDFVFGYTIITKDRLYLIDDVKNLCDNFKDSQTFIHNKIGGESNFVERSVYLDLIAKARYTLIIPTYDPHSISIYRIIESLELDCLPLFHKAVNMEPIIKSFGEIDERLILKDNSFKPFTEDERCDIITSMKSQFCEFRKGFVL